MAFCDCQLFSCICLPALTSLVLHPFAFFHCKEMEMSGEEESER